MQNMPPGHNSRKRKIRCRLTHLGWTFADLAQRLDCSNGNANAICNSKPGTIYNNLLISAAIGVSVQWLLDEEIDISEEVANPSPGASGFEENPPMKERILQLCSEFGISLREAAEAAEVSVDDLLFLDGSTSGRVLLNTSKVFGVMVDDLIK